MSNGYFQIRVTGILVQEEKILLVKQKVSKSRNWSLPGGRVDTGETLEQAIIREMKEETGLDVKVIKLLYLCDKTDSSPQILHITFLLKLIDGKITLPTNEFDENTIHDVKFIAFSDLENLGFTKKFVSKLYDEFSDSGNYMGDKSNIGL